MAITEQTRKQHTRRSKYLLPVTVKHPKKHCSPRSCIKIRTYDRTIFAKSSIKDVCKGPRFLLNTKAATGDVLQDGCS